MEVRKMRHRVEYKHCKIFGRQYLHSRTQLTTAQQFQLIYYVIRVNGGNPRDLTPSQHAVQMSN